MDRETTGTVLSVTKQWWLKVNSKPVRVIGTDGAIYPYIVKVTYHVNGKDYRKRKWVWAGNPVLGVGSSIKVTYDENRPSKAKVL